MIKNNTILSNISYSESIFRIITFITIPLSLIFFKDIIAFQNYIIPKYPNCAKIQDFWFALIASAIIFILRRLFEVILFKYIYRIIDPKHKGIEKIERTKRVVKWIYDVLYYGTMTIFFYKNFGDSDFLPYTLFGRGQCSQMFKGYPDIPNILYLKEYYLIQLGNHFCSVIDQVLLKRDDAKFYEYFLHHYLAFMLIVYSFMLHKWILGALVLVTHDFSDIFLALARALEGQIYFKSIKWFSYSCVGGTVIAWIYFRILVYPSCQMWHALNFWGTPYEVWPLMKDAFTFQYSLLVVLLLMNFYWVLILIRVLVRTIYKKEIDNSYDPKLLKKSINNKTQQY